MAEKEEKKERVYADYDELFSGITPEEAFQIAKDSKSEKNVRTDDWLKNHGYKFSYASLSTYLNKNGYKVDWYKAKVTVDPDSDDELVSFSGVKVRKETLEKWKNMQLDTENKNAKNLVLDTIVLEAISRVENEEIVIKKDEVAEAKKAYAELTKQIAELTAAGDFGEVAKLAKECEKLKKIIG